MVLGPWLLCVSVCSPYGRFWSRDLYDPIVSVCVYASVHVTVLMNGSLTHCRASQVRVLGSGIDILRVKDLWFCFSVCLCARLMGVSGPEICTVQF